MMADTNTQQDKQLDIALLLRPLNEMNHILNWMKSSKAMILAAMDAILAIA